MVGSPMHRGRGWASPFLALAVVLACGSDEEQRATSTDGSGAAGNESSGSNAGGDGGVAAGGGTTPASSSSGLPPDPECEGPLGEPQDPSTLPACCPDYGGAHCLLDVPD